MPSLAVLAAGGPCPAARHRPGNEEGVLLYSTDTDLAPERIFRFYGTRFQIEFAFRDARQYLGLNYGQTRSQARLWAGRPLGPLFLRDPSAASSRRNTQRIVAGSAAG